MKFIPTREQVRSEFDALKQTLLHSTPKQEANAIGLAASIGFVIGLSITGLAVAGAIEDKPTTPEASRQHAPMDPEAALVIGLLGVTVMGATGTLAASSAHVFEEETFAADFEQNTRRL